MKINVRYAGLDGCKAGWWAWGTDGVGNWLGQLYTTLEDFWQAHGGTLITALIDIPIGLLDNLSDPRVCDGWARDQLGGQRSSVFIPPVRATLALLDPDDRSTEAYRRACAVNQNACGKKISKQAFFISFKIKEADDFLHKHPAAQKVLAEAHPELAFQWLKGSALVYKKKEAMGREERTSLLQPHIPNLPGLWADVRGQYLKKEVQDDDMLDAWVLALLAIERLAPLQDHPSPAPIDGEGLPMRLRLPGFGKC